MYIRKKKKPPLLPPRAGGEAPGGRIFKNLLFGVGVLLMCALILFGAVMLHSWKASGTNQSLKAEDFEVEEGPRERVLPGESSDLTFLRNRAGCPLPYFEGQMFLGEIRNAEYGGQNACLVTMTYQSGLVINACAPREAAPLLEIKEMDVLMRGDARITLTGNVGIPALMCEGRPGACLYFETDSAAYAVFAPGTRADALYRYLQATPLSVR